MVRPIRYSSPTLECEECLIIALDLELSIAADVDTDNIPLTTTATGVMLVGVGVARYDELRCWDMTTSLVFFSGLNSTIYSLGKNRQANCTSPLEEVKNICLSLLSYNSLL